MIVALEECLAAADAHVKELSFAVTGQVNML